MEVTQRMERFSDAFMEAVAAVAGYVLEKPATDVYKIDWNLAAPGVEGTRKCPMLGVQLRSVGRDRHSGDHLPFDLDVDTYNCLRGDEWSVPRILVVVMVPKRIERWLRHTESELALRRCAYWVSLRTAAPTTNTTTVRVQVPRAQVLSPAQLEQIMQTIADGGAP